ncbi:MAG: 4Fe-4S binding protein, partial [Syntrophobacteraceae bacterium]|nr:4Fe-4S binding protein [Syntrophobacteraceae bacterium]
MARIPEIDLSACTKCDACVEICPDVFRHNDADF